MNFNDIKRAALLLLAGVSIACSEGLDETAEVSIPQEEAPIFSAEIINQPADESRAYVDMSNYYVRWKTGDKISAFIKGSRTPSSYILTDGDGETVATFGATGTVTAGSKATNCAVYPEDATATFANGNISYHMPATQTYKPGSYAGLEPHMLAHLIENEQFKFRSFVGYIALKLYTDETTDVLIKSVKLETPSGEPISGTMKIYAGSELTEHYEGGEITTGSTSVTLDCGEGVKLSNNKSAPTLLGLVLPVKFRDETGTGGYEGLKFTVTDTQGRTMELTTNRNIGVARGYVTTMAPKLYTPVDPDNAIDLSLVNGEQKPSNCYVVTGPGRYKFPARYVNFNPIGKYENNQYVNPTFSEVKWMWRTPGITVDDDDLNHHYDEATKVEYIYFTVDEFVEGNMSIVARDNTGTDFLLLHNWHIWFVDDLKEIEMKGKGSKNYTLLDRNIGAIKSDIGATSTTDPDRLGLLYQWGRKDPLYNNQAGINMEPEVNPYWKYETSMPSYFTWQYAALGISWKSRNNYPMICALTELLDTNTFDWYNNWFNNDDLSNGPTPLNGSINLLWANSKTIFDPCPVGYRVPSETELFDIKVNASTYELETAAGDKIKLPHQIMNWNGKESNEPEGMIWTSKYYHKYVNGYYGPFLVFGSFYYGASVKYDSQNTWIYDRTFAVPVRCIKE